MDPILALASATAAPKTASDSAPVASAVPTLAKPVKTLLGGMGLLPLFWAAGKAEGVFGGAAPRRTGLRRMGRMDGLSDSISIMINALLPCIVQIRDFKGGIFSFYKVERKLIHVNLTEYVM